jgi:hypothetical protein
LPRTHNHGSLIAPRERHGHPDTGVTGGRNAAPADRIPARPDAGLGTLATGKGNLPLDTIDVHAAITGLDARVQVTQGYHNPFNEPREATSIFPLPDRAAVTSLRMEAADRLIEGVLKERGQARQVYDAAGRRGTPSEHHRGGPVRRRQAARRRRTTSSNRWRRPTAGRRPLYPAAAPGSTSTPVWAATPMFLAAAGTPPAVSVRRPHMERARRGSSLPPQPPAFAASISVAAARHRLAAELSALRAAAEVAEPGRRRLLSEFRDRLEALLKALLETPLEELPKGQHEKRHKAPPETPVNPRLGPPFAADRAARQPADLLTDLTAWCASGEPATAIWDRTIRTLAAVTHERQGFWRSRP